MNIIINIYLEKKIIYFFKRFIYSKDNILKKLNQKIIYLYYLLNK